MTGSRFWCFCSSSGLNYFVAGKKIFSISIFERGMLSRGSCRLKVDLLCILDRYLEVLMSLFYQLDFCFY